MEKRKLMLKLVKLEKLFLVISTFLMGVKLILLQKSEYRVSGHVCLASQGVAAWAITLLGILCAAGCAATAGLSCYVCLAAADIGAGSAVGYCLAQCD
ncbi:hypothetical protein [Paenibacillus riograndensis]|uniref:hypothetical protein n=1 Tax=Paenibacillus riograndensis TaxID=483937 RepID=UPI0014289707|nr:hypothetical protein [Paenibacillus riograndensis]